MKRSRRLKNDGASALVMLVPYAAIAAGAYYLWLKMQASPSAQAAQAALTPGSTSVTGLQSVEALATAPAQTASVLSTDVSQSATGIEGLAGDAITSAKNKLNSLWQSL